MTVERLIQLLHQVDPTAEVKISNSDPEDEIISSVRCVQIRDAHVIKHSKGDIEIEALVTLK